MVKKFLSVRFAKTIVIVVITLATGASALLAFAVHHASAAGGDGVISLEQNKGSGLCLDAGPESNWHEGAYMYTCDKANTNQQWKTPFVHVADRTNVYALESVAAHLPDGRKLCVDHSNIEDQQGFLPYLWACYDGAGQGWQSITKRIGEGSKGKEYVNIYPVGPTQNSSNISGDTTANGGNIYFSPPSTKYADDPYLQWKSIYVSGENPFNLVG